MSLTMPQQRHSAYAVPATKDRHVRLPSSRTGGPLVCLAGSHRNTRQPWIRPGRSACVWHRRAEVGECWVEVVADGQTYEPPVDARVRIDRA